MEKELPVSWRGWKTTSSSSAQNIVTLCYGMNDGGYSTVNPKTLDTYRSTITDIVKRLKKAGVSNIVIGTPGAVDTDSFSGSTQQSIKTR